MNKNERNTISTHYRLPAEWEQQSGIALTWPHKATDWNPYLREITETFVQIAIAIAERELLLIATPEPENVLALLRRRLSESAFARVRICECATNDTWARDHSAISLVPEDNATNQRAKLLDFRFNGWGEKFESTLDNAITQHLVAQGMLCGERIDYSDFVLEGGAIESDGDGTVMTTECCLLAPHRNQPLRKTEIETTLKQRLCAQNILWLQHGSLLGDDTDGHIDTLARFAPNNTLLYNTCAGARDAHFETLKQMEDDLKAFRNRHGEPYRLLSLPLPDPIFYEGERLPATYANFLVINGAVICPTYQQEANDLLAQSVLREAFPQHEIIPIDASVIIRQHGSIHCLTMQFPPNVIK